MVPPGHTQDFLLLDVENEFNLKVAEYVSLTLAEHSFYRFYAELTAEGQVSSFFEMEKDFLQMSNPRTILQPAVVRAEIHSSTGNFLKRNPFNSDGLPFDSSTFWYVLEFVNDKQPIADDLLRMHLEETEGFLKLPVSMWEPV